MRTKILISLFVLVVMRSLCFSQSSYLQLSLFDDGIFTVTLDNTSLSSGNYAEFDNLPAGEHSLKVARVNTSEASEEVIFDNKIKVPAGTDLYAVIDEFNSFVTYKKRNTGLTDLFPLVNLSRNAVRVTLRMIIIIMIKSSPMNAATR